jgi:hypothetical protein
MQVERVRLKTVGPLLKPKGKGAVLVAVVFTLVAVAVAAVMNVRSPAPEYPAGLPDPIYVGRGRMNFYGLQSKSLVDVWVSPADASEAEAFFKSHRAAAWFPVRRTSSAVVSLESFGLKGSDKYEGLAAFVFDVPDPWPKNAWDEVRGFFHL